jgi:hypothetical protein
MSEPKATPHLISAPIFWITPISSARMSRGRRYSGIPTASCLPVRAVFQIWSRCTLLEEVVGRRESCRPGTDDGDFFVPFFGLDFRNVGFTALFFVIGQKAVQFPDGQGLVHIVARALAFARMVADPAADRREGVILFEKLEASL